MTIEIDESNLKEGVLGLVIAVVEILEEALKIQALKRMESGLLADEEIERLGRSLMDLHEAIEQIKTDQGLTKTVDEIRAELDDIVDDVVEKMVNPVDSRDLLGQDTVSPGTLWNREGELC
ncbi:gas vesicle protein K [Methanoregula sp.]|uniref:gas vesicle protein K n=1 Tax=Methanoregula sp. TaxID=2052170 RepID=UPI003562FD8A